MKGNSLDAGEDMDKAVEKPPKIEVVVKGEKREGKKIAIPEIKVPTATLRSIFTLIMYGTSLFIIWSAISSAMPYVSAFMPIFGAMMMIAIPILMIRFLFKVME